MVVLVENAEADANDIRTSLIAALTDKLPNVWQSSLQQYPHPDTGPDTTPTTATHAR
jgi:hypothetical protein